MFVGFAVFEDEEIDTSFGEKELVGGVHDFLSAKVPEVDVDGLLIDVELPGMDFDALGFAFVRIEAIISKPFD